MNLAEADQVGSLGMDDRLLKHPCCKWDLGLSLRKAPPDAETDRQNKKKSRKYQRWMVNRTLKLKDSLGHSVEEATLGMASNISQTCRKRRREVNTVTTEEAAQNFCVPCPAASLPSAGIAKQSPPRDPGNAVPLPVHFVTDSDSLSYPKPQSKKAVAIDCEMVGTGPARKVSELARCTVVNYDGDVIYDKYIRPQLPITDYRTRWSGITWRHMEKAINFVVARAEILQIVRDKIVVGHALHNDFRALKYFHPQEWTRDTSQSPLLRGKGGLPLKASVSLKSLAQQLLHKEIQVSRKGHSSVEDAQASMELYRLVEVQWEKDMASRLSLNPANSPPLNCTDNDHYLDDQYWPEDLNLDCK